MDLLQIVRLTHFRLVFNEQRKEAHTSSKLQQTNKWTNKQTNKQTYKWTNKRWTATKKNWKKLNGIWLQNSKRLYFFVQKLLIDGKVRGWRHFLNIFRKSTFFWRKRKYYRKIATIRVTWEFQSRLMQEIRNIFFHCGPQNNWMLSIVRSRKVPNSSLTALIELSMVWTAWF